MRRNAIVIVVDRLGTGHLGPYGNTWVETPALNRLASEGIVWEQAFADSLTLEAAYRAAGGEIWEALRAAGIATAVVTDEPELAHSLSPAAVGQWVDCRAASESVPADSPEESAVARPFLAALDWLEHAEQPFCLWLHARGMDQAWDAPYEFRARFADEDDPQPPTFVDPPHQHLGEEPDPDELLGLSQAYAAQVVILDMCLEMLLDQLAAQKLLDETMILLTSPRGFALGEHGGVGKYGDDLQEEVLHVPLIVRTPEEKYSLTRCQTLVQPMGRLLPTVANWLGVGAASPDDLTVPTGPLARHVLTFRTESTRAIRTPAWFLRRSGEGTPQLFAKPDDRWEVNEVAGRCSDIVEELATALDSGATSVSDRLLKVEG